MKLESMSKNIVDIMIQMTKNDGLVRLLVNNTSNPFETPVTDTSVLINPTSPNSKIHPYPFDPDATTEDGAFIRIYYNTGSFDSVEVISEAEIHIDVICARSLWLINDGNRSLIRPYEIIGRVVDMLGHRSLNNIIKLEFNGYQHLYINQKFDALRLYCSYTSIETM